MKIAIIGAGINGLYLAQKLAKNGYEVTVFEKNGKIGKETCSGLFSEKILDFIPESEILIENKINFCLIHFPKKTLKINFKKNFFIMNHYKLDNLMAKFAKDAGVKIILNYNLKKDWFLNLSNDFDKIIGCDGSNSIVREILKLPKPNFRLGILGFIDEKNYSNFVETWPTKNGFIWKIPRGEKIEYGIIEKPKIAKLLFDKFLKEKKLFIKRIKSAIISQGLIIPRNQKITLCGDAAGLTKPWSGGGVIWGLIAADFLLKNFPDFIQYKNMLKKFFLPKILFSKIAAKIIYFSGFNFPWILPKKVKIEGDFLI